MRTTVVSAKLLQKVDCAMCVCNVTLTTTHTQSYRPLKTTTMNQGGPTTTRQIKTHNKKVDDANQYRHQGIYATRGHLERTHKGFFLVRVHEKQLNEPTNGVLYLYVKISLLHFAWWV